MAKRKTFTTPLAADLAEGILQLPLTVGADTRPLAEWVEQVQEVQRAANVMLQSNRLAEFVADQIMQGMGKRGSPGLVLTPGGEVRLQVSYDQPRTKRASPVARESRTSNLPVMVELRERAAKLGVDISHLGRQRRAIHELLEKEDNGLPTAPSQGPIRGTHVLDLATGVSTPIEDEDTA